MSEPLTQQEWEAGEPCPEGCGQWVDCAHRNTGAVYATETGDAFHNTRDCEALRSGQDWAQSKGFSANEIKPVTKGWALNQGKQPCLICIGIGK